MIFGNTNGGPTQPLLAGQITASLSNFSLLEHREDILLALAETIQIGDVAVLIFLGWATLPLARLIYDMYFRRKKGPEDDPLSSRSSSSEFDEYDDPFFSSLTYQISNMIGQVAQLSCLVYIFDCFIILWDVATPDHDLQDFEISFKFAQLVYMTWAAFRLMSFKQHLLCLAARRRLNKLGKVGVYDRIIDILILFSLSIAVLDLLNLDLGPGLASLFAFGGVGTVVFSLASKDMAAQLVSGVVVSTSENFYVGDDIKLGTDTCGIVDRLGWFYTDVRGYDELITRIPNEQLANRRICNLSRMKKCRIKKKLRFRHSDWDKVTPFCADIKKEIAKECPELISDGSRPFRAFLTDFRDDHLEVTVDTHFNLPPTGSVYLENQHKVLELICAVLKRNDIEVALPSRYITSDKVDVQRNLEKKDS